MSNQPPSYSEPHFSWSDTLKIAVGSCFPSSGPCSCLRPTTTDPESDSEQEEESARRLHAQRGSDRPFANAVNNIPRARPDELQGLLFDVDANSDGTSDVDAMSLHSNPGGRKRQRRKKAKSRQISLFGYNLFGKPKQAIKLPENGEDALYGSGAAGPRTHRARTTSTGTSSTLDSDAAPLDVDTISVAVKALESPPDASPLELNVDEEQKLRDKEERKQRRLARKERKRLAQLMNSHDGREDEFEGFQGSSGFGARFGLAHAQPGSVSSGSGSGTRSSTSRHHLTNRPLAAASNADDEDEDADADFDGAAYVRRAVKTVSGGDSGSRGSGSMSCSSASRSNLGASAVPGQNTLAPDDSTSGIATERAERRYESSRSSASASASRTSASHTSQSPNITTPTSPSFSSLSSSSLPTNQVEAKLIGPSTIEKGLGFFDIENSFPPEDRAPQPPVSDVAVGAVRGDFPSTGFGSRSRSWQDDRGQSGRRFSDAAALFASR